MPEVSIITDFFEMIAALAAFLVALIMLRETGRMREETRKMREEYAVLSASVAELRSRIQ